MKEAWDNAQSIESFEGDWSDLEEIGRKKSIVQPDKDYLFFRDKAGNFWYRTEYQTDKGRMSEYEYIFGKKEKRKPRKKK